MKPETTFFMGIKWVIHDYNRRQPEGKLFMEDLTKQGYRQFDIYGGGTAKNIVHKNMYGSLFVNETDTSEPKLIKVADSIKVFYSFDYGFEDDHDRAFEAFLKRKELIDDLETEIHELLKETKFYQKLKKLY